MTSRVRVETETVPINLLQPHPQNPRRGDTQAIEDSLRYHGQYRPIVAQRDTNLILAGNHTWQAARKLGWRSIAVTWVDCDEPTATRILLADNRCADLATYDDHSLVDLLKSLPDLDGTGFEPLDVDRIEQNLNLPIDLTDEPTAGEPGPAGGGDAGSQIRLGDYEIEVDPDVFDAWTDRFGNDRKPSTVIKDLRERLNLQVKAVTPADGEERHPANHETVPITILQPYPNNPRQGDIGAISESLRTLGQYRPLVVNRSNGQILVGNHTWHAARALGWEQIAVTYMDVDDTEAAKIVAVDNRTSDLATYSDDTLTELLATLHDPFGTGYTPSDLDELLTVTANGGRSRKPAPTSKVPCKVGPWTWKATRNVWDDWCAALAVEIKDGSIYTWIATTLDIPDNTWTPIDPDTPTRR